ncbi:MAG TPA: 50S ribosomal protein L17 [Methylomirabilota bacterium]|nr:50S ribosomal protein L17 [Methylomirabilota bacterium]
MRHLKRTAKLGRQFEHRNAMLANMVSSLIIHKRITTTLAKAKAVRSVAEKMVTLGKKGSIHSRRLAVARLHNEETAKILFTEIAPKFKERAGGYTRIIKLARARRGDAGEQAILEWVDIEQFGVGPTAAAQETAATTPATGEAKTEGKAPEAAPAAETKADEAK